MYNLFINELQRLLNSNNRVHDRSKGEQIKRKNL